MKYFPLSFTLDKRRSTVFVNTVVIACVGLFDLLYLSIVLKAPFAEGQDIFAHMKYATNILVTHHVDFAYNTFESSPPLYQYFPFFHIDLAVIAQVLGIEVFQAAVVMHVLIIILVPLLLFVVGSAIFMRKSVGLFLVFLYLFPGPPFVEHGFDFIYPSPHYFSLIAFLTALLFLLHYIRRGGNWYVFGYVLSFLSMVLYHPQSAVGRVPMLALVALLLCFVKDKIVRKRARTLLLVSILYVALFLIMNFHALYYISQVGQQYSNGNTSPLLVPGVPIPEESLATIIGNFSPVIGIFSLFGFFLVFLVHSKENLMLPRVIIVAVSAVSLLLTYQYIFGYNFFPGRFRVELLFPLLLLTSYGFRYIFTRLRYSTVLFIPFLVIMILPFLSSLSHVSLNVDWGYLRAVSWARKHINNSAIIADPYTFTVFASSAILTPPYNIGTNLQRIEKKDNAIQKVFGGFLPESAMWAKHAGIQYVIVDYARNPGRVAGHYEQFSDIRYYERLYAVRTGDPDRKKELVIYRIR